jgi:hypothetical protein
VLNFKNDKEISKVVKLQVKVLRTIATGWTCFRAAVNIMELSNTNARTQDKRQNMPSTNYCV